MFKAFQTVFTLGVGFYLLGTGNTGLGLSTGALVLAFWIIDMNREKEASK